MLELPLEDSPVPAQSVPSPDALEQATREIAYQMAYGLSHELNNPLANIAARARLLAEAEPDLVKRQQLAAIVDQAMRGCEMIADLMLLARPPREPRVPVDIAALLQRLVERANLAAKPSGICVRPAAVPLLRAPHTLASARALEEALWATLRNALEAASSRVEIALTNHEAIGGVRLEITDDGAGLSPEALRFAFHPFFCGREAGRGIGLGLSKAQRILHDHGGQISISSAAPNGCRVTIDLPLEQP